MKVGTCPIIFALLHIKVARCGQTHTDQAVRHESSFIKSDSALVMATNKGVQTVPPELEMEAPGQHEVLLQQLAPEEPPRKSVLSFLGAPPEEGKKGEGTSGDTWTARMEAHGPLRAWLEAHGTILVQLLFGVIYYFLIVVKYPKLDHLEPTPEAIKLQSENEVPATLRSSWPNCFFSFFCSGPRAAHTFHSAGVWNFWPGCITMSLCQCCTLWLVNSFTDLNVKLGGERRGLFMGLVMSCCCSCCVIARDAESLDMITGARTNLCGVDIDNVHNRESSLRLA